MSKRRGVRGSTALIALLAAWILHANPAPGSPVPWPPLDIPIPSNVTLSDLLATGTPSGDGSGPLPGAQSCRSARRHGISLPADDAPHNGTEWEYWWWYGHLTTPDGHRFGFLVTPAGTPWAHYYGIDYALTDVTDGTFHQGREPLIVGQPQSTPEGFAVQGKHAQATGSAGRFRLRFDVDGYHVDLTLKPNKVPVLEGGPASDMYCLNLYYYERPRMTATGTISYRGKPMHVTGTGDFHHQWGFFPAVATGTFGWNVITFALRDGRDITLFDGSAPGHDKTFTADSGFISNAQGGVRLLHHSDFAITPTRFWHRDSDCSYPVDWNVRVRTGTGWLDLHTDAKVDSAELRATGHPEAYVVAANYTGYWDGPTSVGGDASGEGWLDTGHYCSTTSDLPPDTLAILGPEGSNPSTPVPLTPVALPGRGLPKVADVSTLGPDGAIWFDEAMSNKIGRITPAGAITEFALPHAMSAPVGITKGPDGAVWFTEWLGDRIGRITTSGAISEFPVPQGAGPGGIATGRDGAIWFTESRSDKIGRLTTDGTLTEYPLPQRGAFADDMRAGSDSAIWFTEAAANKIGRITLSGHLTEFRVPTPASWPFAIAPGPDNAMWFVETFGNKLGRVGCHGKITEVQLPQPLSGPGDIAVGPDRALWFPEIAGNRIGRLGRSGNLTEFPVPTVGGAPFALTAGSDGNLWFPELGANKIGRITITGQVTEYPLPS